MDMLTRGHLDRPNIISGTKRYNPLEAQVKYATLRSLAVQSL